VIAIVRKRNKVWSRFIVVALMFIAKIDKTMQNRKFDKWFEQIILVFAYFFLFLLYNIGLSSLFWKSEMNNIR
jgi:hypothetical protein